MKYLICLDLDGSTLNNKSKIDDYTVKIVDKLVEKGHTVALVTGRPFVSTIDFYRQLKLNTLLIADNGASIYYPNNKEFKPIIKYIDLETAKSILKENKKYTNSMFYAHKDEVYAYKHNAELEYTFNGLVSNKAFEIDENTMKISPIDMIFMIQTNKMLHFENNLEKYKDTVSYRLWGTHENNAFYEIHNKNVSKWSAIKYLINYYNFSEDQVITIGDGVNDYEMIKKAKYGVKMKNHSSALSNLDVLTTKYDNDNLGLAKFLESFVLNK